MGMLFVKLMVRIDPSGLLVNGLLSLSQHVALSYSPRIPFHLPIVKDLHSPLSLNLQAISLFLCQFLLSLKLHLSDLHGSLQKNGILLLLGESLEVVWLDSVRSEG